MKNNSITRGYTPYDPGLLQQPSQTPAYPTDNSERELKKYYQQYNDYYKQSMYYPPGYNMPNPSLSNSNVPNSVFRNESAPNYSNSQLQRNHAATN